MRLFALVLALAATAPLSIAVAQKKPPAVSDADLKAAKEHFNKSEQHFRLREFDLAIPELKEAYRLYPNPLFLYNIAQCYLELKKYEEAVSFFENFIEVDPKNKSRAQAEKYLAQAQKGLAEEQEKKRKEEEARVEQERLQKMLELENQQKNPPPTDKGKPIYAKPWFWAAVGGTAAVGTGTAITISILSSIPNTDLGNKDILDK